jgi:hypothetical protein
MKLQIVSLALGMTALAAGSASAQEFRPERPFRGLFGSGTAGAQQVLTISGTLSAGYDTNVLSDAADEGLGGVSAAQKSGDGTFGGVSGAMSYSLDKDSIDLGASASTSSRYYPTVDRTFMTSHSGNVGMSWKYSTRTTISAGQSISYQPFTLYALFPELQQPPLGEAVMADLDYNSLQRGYQTYGTTAGFSRQLSPRSAFSADYSYHRSTFGGRTTDFNTHAGNVRFTRMLTNGFGLRLGYGYTLATYGVDDVLDDVRDDVRSIGRHLIDTGVDYNKSLSFSRRTTLTLTTGGTATTDQSETHFSAIGGANLVHEMGRTWDFTTAYNRNVGFVETFAEPFFYDALNIGLRGLFSRRWSFQAGAGAVLGSVGLGSNSRSSNDFDTLYASSSVSRALNRHLSLGINYSFYRYSFDDNTLLPEGFNTDLGRHSVSATLNAWMPLFERGRRRNASR